MGPDSGLPRRRLDSWKDVAEYLARDVSTAMRWAKTDGLPVHHIGGAHHRAVFAWTDEIDAWLASQIAADHPNHRDTTSSPQPVRPAPFGSGRVRLRPGWAWWVLVAAAVVAAGTWWSGGWAGATHDVAKAALVDATLHAFDASGREVWRYEVPADGRVVLAPRITVKDVDGDGHPDVLAALTMIRPPGDGTGAVMLFDARGRLRWTQTLDDRYRFGSSEYAPGWYPDDVVVFRAGEQMRVAAAWHHHTWWPSVVSVSDADGRVMGRFVNAGWIHQLLLSRDGRYLLASGVSNAFGGAMLAVLDAARIDGASPAADGSLPSCSNCPAGVPTTYLVVPWSDVARPPDSSPVRVHVTHAGSIELRAAQRAESSAGLPELIVELSPALSVLRREASDTFASEHRRMEESGALTHPFERCPWRTPAVRVWTREAGWQILQ